ncbi:hypothetical protein KR074_010312, partial [Drosophila pseudoananassae]
EYNTKTASCHAIHYYHQPNSYSSFYQHKQLTSSASTSSSTSSLQPPRKRYSLPSQHRVNPFELDELNREQQDLEELDDDLEEPEKEEEEEEQIDEEKIYVGVNNYQRSLRNRNRNRNRRHYKYDAVEECCRPIFQEQHYGSIADML